MTLNGLERRALGFQIASEIEIERNWIGKIQTENAEKEERISMSQNLRLEDEAVLDELLECDFRGDTAVALTLVPLVSLAWIDGRVSKNEQREILAEATRSGIQQDSPAYAKLVQWFQSYSPQPLETLWGHFVSAYLKTLSPQSRFAFIEHQKAQMRRVVVASHLLGISIFSHQEIETIARLSTWLCSS